MGTSVDVVIIGAGSAGLFALSQVKKVTDSYVLINGGELGTTCARVGCMPSKVMIQVAEDFHRRTIFDREGIEGEESLSVIPPECLEHVQDLRDVFVDQVLMTTDAMGEELIDGYARFVDQHTVEVNGEHITAQKFIIATGSTPIVPAAWASFRDRVLTTDEIFELEDLPASMAVIGLGIIGLEMGQAMHRLGVEMTAIDQLESLAGLVDPLVNEVAVATISKEMTMWLGNEASIEELDNGQLKVRSGENEVIVDTILAAMGRRPNLDKLSLDKTGVTLGANSLPNINPNTMQVDDLPIFIAGDVTGERAILHEAGFEGRVAGYNAVQEVPVAFLRKTPLAITFCDPNIATAGAQLNELDIDTIVIGEIKFGPVGRALIMGKNKGVLRVYVQRSDGLVLGAAMVAPRGEHLANIIAWAIQQKMTVHDLLKMPFYHPTIEEALQAALNNCLSKLDVSEELPGLERC